MPVRVSSIFSVVIALAALAPTARASAEATGCASTAARFDPPALRTDTEGPSASAHAGREMGVVGFYYFRLRYLDPELGRFVSRDPLGIWGDAGQFGNAYSFAGNDPVNRVDPWGLLGAGDVLDGTIDVVAKLVGTITGILAELGHPIQELLIAVWDGLIPQMGNWLLSGQWMDPSFWEQTAYGLYNYYSAMWQAADALELQGHTWRAQHLRWQVLTEIGVSVYTAALAGKSIVKFAAGNITKIGRPNGGVSVGASAPPQVRPTPAPRPTPSEYVPLEPPPYQQHHGGVGGMGMESPHAGGGGAPGAEPPTGVRPSPDNTPAIEGTPYAEEVVGKRVRPPYQANPAHDPSSPLFNPRKTPEPSDAAVLYATAVRANMYTWYARNPCGQIYRYFADNAGGVHFSGVVPENLVPNAVLKQLKAKKQ